MEYSEKRDGESSTESTRGQATSAETNALALQPGSTRSGEPVLIALSQMRHLLVLGSPQQTRPLVLSMLTHLNAGNDADHLHLSFLDEQSETVMLFQDTPHRGAMPALPHLFAERVPTGRRHFPFLLISTDSWQQFVQREGWPLVLSEGAKCAVGLVLTTETLALPELILANMPTHILLPHELHDLAQYSWQATLLSSVQGRDDVQDPLLLWTDGHAQWLSARSVQ